jgi:hypothetical protein
MLGKLVSKCVRPFSTPEVFRFPSSHPFEVSAETTEVFVRRVIKCIRERLVNYDPLRWNEVPFSYESHWLRPDGKVDVATCIQVHEALEKEFKIEIMDQRVLITDVATACGIVSGKEGMI